MKRLHLTTLSLALALAACSSTTNKPDNDIQETYVQNPKNTISWTGTYQGITPCANCDGIATMIVLKPNLEYQMRTRMLGIEEIDKKSEGTFVWQADNTHIEILPEDGIPKIYRVNNDFIELTLPNGEQIPTGDSNQYRLYKTD